MQLHDQPSLSHLEWKYLRTPDIVLCMAAKKNRKRQSRRVVPEIHEIDTIHFQASRRRDELLEDARELKAAGKIRQARELLKQAKAIQRQLRAFEQEIRQGH
jgi:uncharacterized protein with WD repeat